MDSIRDILFLKIYIVFINRLFFSLSCRMKVLRKRRLIDECSKDLKIYLVRELYNIDAFIWINIFNIFTFWDILRNWKTINFIYFPRRYLSAFIYVTNIHIWKFINLKSREEFESSTFKRWNSSINIGIIKHINIELVQIFPFEITEKIQIFSEGREVWKI